MTALKETVFHLYDQKGGLVCICQDIYPINWMRRSLWLERGVTQMTTRLGGVYDVVNTDLRPEYPR